MTLSLEQIDSLEDALRGITIEDGFFLLRDLGGSDKEHVYINSLGHTSTLKLLAKSPMRLESAHRLKAEFCGGPNGTKVFKGTLKTFIMDRLLYLANFMDFDAMIREVHVILSTAEGAAPF